MKLFFLILLCSLLVAVSPLSDRYHTYEEIQAQLTAWNDEFGSSENPNYPDGGIVYKLIEVGFSHEDNLPIWGAKLTYNADIEQDKPKILFLGQCHAEEILGIEISMALIDILLHPTPQPGTSNMPFPNGYRPSFGDLNSTNITSILENTEVWVIPTHNPEGLTVVHGWEENGEWFQDVTFRKNKHDLDGNNIFNFIVGQGNDSDGVDLNRNYDFNWMNGDDIYEPDNGGCNGSYFTNFDYYRGPEPFSESETQAIRDLALEQDFLISIAYHSSRSGCLSEKVKFSWVWEEDQLSPDADVISRLGENIAGLIETVDGTGAGYYEPSFSGSHKGVAHDWFYAKTGCFQYLIEVGEGGDGMQPSDEQDINKIVHNNLKGAFFAINRTAGINSGTLAADKYMVTGIISDIDTGLPILNAEVEILEMSDPILTPRLTNYFGRYYRLLKDDTYTIKITVDGYQSEEYIFTSSADDITIVNFSLVQIEDCAGILNGTALNDECADCVEPVCNYFGAVSPFSPGMNPCDDDEFPTSTLWNASCILSIQNLIPREFGLMQNYPNPFNPTTNFIFELSRIENISLSVYNINGGLVETIINNEIFNRGQYHIQYDASHLESGIYLYTLESHKINISKKFAFIK